MKSNAKNRIKELEELLESDDEFPYVYDEIPEIPAYLNDNRFGYTNSPSIEDDESKSSVSFESPEVTSTNTIQQKNDEKILIRKGFLNKRDVYCLKSIEALVSDTTLLWFIDFLMYKDLQSKHYGFIQSCLVRDIDDHYSVKNESCMDVEDYELKLVFNE